MVTHSSVGNVKCRPYSSGEFPKHTALNPACSRRRQGRANPALRLPQSNLTAAARLTLTVGAPSKAWRFLQSESLCRIRPNPSFVPSVAVVTEALPNKTTEAYTGNHIGHKEDRTS